MNETAEAIEQSDADVLAFDVPDAALEIAAAAIPGERRMSCGRSPKPQA